MMRDNHSKNKKFLEVLSANFYVKVEIWEKVTTLMRVKYFAVLKTLTSSENVKYHLDQVLYRKKQTCKPGIRLLPKVGYKTLNIIITFDCMPDRSETEQMTVIVRFVHKLESNEINVEEHGCNYNSYKKVANSINAEDMCPISTLPAIEKILEKRVYIQLKQWKEATDDRSRNVRTVSTLQRYQLLYLFRFELDNSHMLAFMFNVSLKQHYTVVIV
nr:unnamed protein product [Callosobruchus analis]